MSTSPTLSISEPGDVFERLAACHGFLTARDVAKMLAISEKTVYSYVSRNMTHPVLNSSYIKTFTQHARCVSGSKGLQIELRRVEASSLSDRFTGKKHVLLTFAGR